MFFSYLENQKVSEALDPTKRKYSRALFFGTFTRRCRKIRDKLQLITVKYSQLSSTHYSISNVHDFYLHSIQVHGVPRHSEELFSCLVKVHKAQFFNMYIFYWFNIFQHKFDFLYPKWNKRMNPAANTSMKVRTDPRNSLWRCVLG